MEKHNQLNANNFTYRIHDIRALEIPNFVEIEAYERRKLLKRYLSEG